MSAPSAGALRAADGIMNAMVTAHGVNFGDLAPEYRQSIAAKIDRETASKELAEALRDILGPPGTRRVVLELHKRGLAALAKYEARQ